MTEDKNIELPIQECDIKVKVGRDGVWIQLGANYQFNVMTALDVGHIIGANVNNWCVARQDQANAIARKPSE